MTFVLKSGRSMCIMESFAVKGWKKHNIWQTSYEPHKRVTFALKNGDTMCTLKSGTKNEANTQNESLKTLQTTQKSDFCSKKW